MKKCVRRGCNNAAREGLTECQGCADKRAERQRRRKARDPFARAPRREEVEEAKALQWLVERGYRAAQGGQ